MAFGAADQMNWVDWLCTVDPSAGAVRVGAGLVSQLVAAGTLKRPCADSVEGHPAKSDSTYHSTAPVAITACRLVSWVVPSAAKGTPPTAAHTRYALACKTAFHWNSTDEEPTETLPVGETRLAG